MSMLPTGGAFSGMGRHPPMVQRPPIMPAGAPVPAATAPGGLAGLSGMLRNPLLQMGLGILSQSGPSRLPQGLSGIGRGAMLGMQQAQAAEQAHAAQQLQAMQMAALKRKQEQEEAFKAAYPNLWTLGPSAAASVLAARSKPKKSSRLLSKEEKDKLVAQGVISPAAAREAVEETSLGGDVTGYQFGDPGTTIKVGDELPTAPLTPEEKTAWGIEDEAPYVMTKNGPKRIVTRTEAERSKQQAAEMAVESLDRAIGSLERGDISARDMLTPKWFKSDEATAFDRNFREALRVQLRRETGAEARQSEVDELADTYGPKPWKSRAQNLEGLRQLKRLMASDQLSGMGGTPPVIEIQPYDDLPGGS